MKITLPDRTVVEKDFDGVSIEELLKSLGLNSASVIVTMNGAVVPEDLSVKNTDELRIISFSHGG